MSKPAKNSRRFFRINMPVRYAILSKTTKFNQDIFTAGGNYYPVSVKTKLNQIKNQLNQSTEKIQEHQEALQIIFEEIQYRANRLEHYINLLTQGTNPRNDPDLWREIRNYAQGFKKTHILETAAPKTYNYLKMIEQQYIFYMRTLIESLQNSTLRKFYAPNFLPEGFKIDELLELLADEKYAAVPLVQSIINIANYLNLHTDIFKTLYNKYVILSNPPSWPLEKVNISASGLAIETCTSYQLYERLTVKIYLEDYRTTLSFDAVVVNVRHFADQKTRVAMNFEFPDGNSQKILQTKIQRYEIQECMDLEI